MLFRVAGRCEKFPEVAMATVYFKRDAFEMDEHLLATPKTVLEMGTDRVAVFCLCDVSARRTSKPLHGLIFVDGGLPFYK